jgi:hypothetical protein
VENLEESDHLMMRAEKELISLKQLKDDKTVELQQVSSKFSCLFPIRKKLLVKHLIFQRICPTVISL